MLITSAEDLVKGMGWESSPKTEKTVQRELFPDLSEEEERIVKRLGKIPGRITNQHIGDRHQHTCKPNECITV